MRAVCAELDEFNSETDHVHLLVAYPPTAAISVLAQHLKPHRRQRPARVHRRLRSRPHAQPPLVAVLLRGLLHRRTAVDPQYIDGQARPL
jgi:putative transposase